MAPETVDATALDPGPWLLSCGCLGFADGTFKGCDRHGDRLIITIKAADLATINEGGTR